MATYRGVCKSQNGDVFFEKAHHFPAFISDLSHIFHSYPSVIKYGKLGNRPVDGRGNGKTVHKWGSSPASHV